MATFLPFSAILPKVDLAAQVATLPFDRYTSAQKEEILSSNPYSFLHVILAQGKQKEAGRHVLDSFLQTGVLKKTETPSFLVYRQIQNSNCFTGFIGVLPIGKDSDYQAIKKHEATLVQKEAVLADYLHKTNLNAEPALLTFNANTQSQNLLHTITNTEPNIDLSLPTFGRHQLWIIDDLKIQADIKNVFADLPNLYVADGHHRISSSRRLALQRFQQHGNALAADQFVLAACFPSNEAQILPYHRIIKTVPTDFLDQLKSSLEPTVTLTPSLFADPDPNHWMLRFQRQWFRLNFNPPLPTTVLPADWLNNHVLSPLLQMHDLSKDKNIGFVGGMLAESDLVAAQEAALADVLFVLPAVQFQQFFTIVNQGRLMPPKSTWFEPKLLSGFTMFDLTGTLSI